LHLLGVEDFLCDPPAEQRVRPRDAHGVIVAAVLPGVDGTYERGEASERPLALIAPAAQLVGDHVLDAGRVADGLVSTVMLCPVRALSARWKRSCVVAASLRSATPAESVIRRVLFPEQVVDDLPGIA
jgi:hypothetical protein